MMPSIIFASFADYLFALTMLCIIVQCIFALSSMHTFVKVFVWFKCFSQFKDFFIHITSFFIHFTQCPTARTWGCTAELTWLVRTLVLSTVQSARYILITTKKKKKIYIAFITLLILSHPSLKSFFCENDQKY